MEEQQPGRPAQIAAPSGKKRTHARRFWIILAAVVAAACTGLYFIGLQAIPLLAAARTAAAFSTMKNAGVDYGFSVSVSDAADHVTKQVQSDGEFFRVDGSNGTVGGTLRVRSDGADPSEQKTPFVATFSGGGYTLMLEAADFLGDLKSLLDPGIKYLYLDSRDFAASSQSAGAGSSASASSSASSSAGSGKGASGESRGSYTRLGTDVAKAVKTALTKQKPQITRRYDLSGGLNVVLSADFRDFQPERIVDAFAGDAQSVKDLQNALDQDAGAIVANLAGGETNADELLKNLKTTLNGQKIDLRFTGTGSLGGIRSVQLRMQKPNAGGVSIGLSLSHLGERRKVTPLAQPDDADVLNLGKLYQTALAGFSGITG